MPCTVSNTLQRMSVNLMVSPTRFWTLKMKILYLNVSYSPSLNQCLVHWMTEYSKRLWLHSSWKILWFSLLETITFKSEFHFDRFCIPSLLILNIFIYLYNLAALHSVHSYWVTLSSSSFLTIFLSSFQNLWNSSFNVHLNPLFLAFKIFKY